MKKTILIIALIVFALTSSLFLNIYNQKFYEKKFEQLDVELENRDELNKNVLDFLRYKTDDLPFTQRENDHMKDVRFVLSVFYIIFLISIATIVVFLIRSKETIFLKSFLFSGSIIIGISLILLILALFNFDLLFDNMHSLLFRQGTFTFNPQQEIIVVLYPEEIFMSIARRIFFTFLIIGNIYILSSLFLNRRCNR